MIFTEEFLGRGPYFKLTNPTFDTAVTMGIRTAFSATNNVLFCMVTNGLRKVIPHYLRLICGVAGASTTSSRLAIVMDNINRYSSGGTDYVANARDMRQGSNDSPALSLIRYACTCVAANAPRNVANLGLKTQAAPCWTVGDQVLIKFGDGQDTDVATGTGPMSIVRHVGPCMLEGVNQSLLFHMWNIANATTAPSWEWELAWKEVT